MSSALGTIRVTPAIQYTRSCRSLLDALAGKHIISTADFNSMKAAMDEMVSRMTLMEAQVRELRRPSSLNLNPTAPKQAAMRSWKDVLSATPDTAPQGRI